MEKSALSLLQHDELCEVRTDQGIREARWRPNSRIFYFTDNNEPRFIPAEDTLEWWQAWVKF
ncbi:MAG TPA: hypothetical protein VEC35_01440 [Noviherbaspirillum sp.]|nr:hypothetical protein [Noviherbaspirillum sp.]